MLGFDWLLPGEDLKTRRREIQILTRAAFYPKPYTIG